MVPLERRAGSEIDSAFVRHGLTYEESDAGAPISLVLQSSFE
jgi:hypothetical protein